MQLETKYLRLRMPVELGSRFDDWQVCWLGGWSKHGLYFLVMLVKVRFEALCRGCGEATSATRLGSRRANGCRSKCYATLGERRLPSGAKMREEP